MASNSGKIRFVRCPKCLQLLIEYTNVALYQCGGCGTVLKAKNKNGNEEIPDLKLEEIQNLNNNNNNLEIISPDNLSIFSTEPNNTNTPSSSNAQLSESDENEFKPIPQISSPKNLTPPNCEKEETLISQSVVSEEDTHSTIHDDGTRSTVSNAYDGGISSSDEGKRKIPNKTLILAKSRRTFRKRVPSTSENSFKEKELGLPPRPPNERLHNNNNNNNITYSRNEIEQGVSLDSNDFEIIQSLLENDSPTPNLINKLKSLDRGERLRKMDELRSHLRKFSIKGGGDEKKYRRKEIDSNQRSYYQKPKSQETPLCFDSRHNSNNTHQEKLPFYPYSPSQHSCACIHCTNANGLYRPNQNISNLYAQSSYSNSPRSVDQDSIKSSFKAKRSIVRKHICRPILGATPFVICKNCFNLLQIPSTILISKKRGTKVQCGNCSEVLTVPFPYNQKIAIDSRDNGVDFMRSYSSGVESDGSDGGKDASESVLHKLMGYNSATELLHTHGF
ncbi:hypothetical protein LUZ60_015447 [Juncus effusus]|nr:hypothetical protein LUZ60_015447 [Juncus effusus]